MVMSNTTISIMANMEDFSQTTVMTRPSLPSMSPNDGVRENFD